MRITGTAFAARSAASAAIAAQASPIPPQGDVNPDLLIPRNATHAYIYALIDPRTNAVRYIGKAFDVAVRYKSHCKGNDTTRSARWVRELAAFGLKPTVEIVEIINSTSPDEWSRAERQWIANFKLMGYDLTNLTSGGDGAFAFTDEIKALISVSSKGKPKPAGFGAAISRAQKGRKKPASVCAAVAAATPSCSLAGALARQDLFINQAVSTYALNLLWQLLRHWSINRNGGFLNLATGSTRPIPLT